MNFRALSLAVALTAGTAFALTGYDTSARVTGEVDATMRSLLVTTDEEGQELLIEVSEAAPGDILEYRVSYTNLGSDELKNFEVNGPVPTSTFYIGESAAGQASARLEVSIDNGKTWETEPVIRLRKDENGELSRVVIPPSEYTSIRWMDGDLPSGETVVYSYRVEVE